MKTVTIIDHAAVFGNKKWSVWPTPAVAKRQACVLCFHQTQEKILESVYLNHQL